MKWHCYFCPKMHLQAQAQKREKMIDMTKQSLAEVSVVVFKTRQSAALKAAPSVGKIKLTLTNRRLTRTAWRVTERVISCHSAGRESVSFDSKGTVLLAPSQAPALRAKWQLCDMRHNSSAFCHKCDFLVSLQRGLLIEIAEWLKTNKSSDTRPKHFIGDNQCVCSISHASVLNAERCAWITAWSAFTPMPKCSAQFLLKTV